jgi:hypothetical protein
MGPNSKQPMFKSGVVRIENVPAGEDGTVKIHAQEQQTSAIHKVEEKKGIAADVKNNEPRECHLGYWMGAT